MRVLRQRIVRRDRRWRRVFVAGVAATLVVAGVVACRKAPPAAQGDASAPLAVPSPSASASLTRAVPDAAALPRKFGPLEAGVGDWATTAETPTEDPFAKLPKPRVEPPFRGTAVELPIARILETTPPGFAFDAKVDEWASLPPSATLTSKNGGTKVWLAFTELGLIVAGDVDPSAERDGVVLDKLRVSFGFAPPAMPAIGFMSHLFTDEVDEAFCEKTAEHGFDERRGPPDPAARTACLDWLGRCREVRRAIDQRFERSLVIDLATGTFTFTPLPGAQRPLVSTGGNMDMRAANGRRTFEAVVSPNALPESGEYPLRTVRAAVRAFTDKGPPSGKPSTSALAWKTQELASPRPLHKAAALMSRIAAHAAAAPNQRDPVHRVAFSYVPATTTSRVTFYYNRGSAGQWAPTTPSPLLADVDVARGRTLLTLPACAAGATELCSPGSALAIDAHAVWIDDEMFEGHPQVALVSKRDGAVLDVSAFSSADPYALVKRAPGVHALAVYQGPSGPYGSGPGGLMPGYRFEMTTMDRDGNFAPLPQELELGVWRDSIRGLGVVPGGEGLMSSPMPELAIDPKLRFFGLRGTISIAPISPEGGTGEFVFQRFEALYRWDEAAKRYVYAAMLKPEDAGAR